MLLSCKLQSTNLKPNCLTFALIRNIITTIIGHGSAKGQCKCHTILDMRLLVSVSSTGSEAILAESTERGIRYGIPVWPLPRMSVNGSKGKRERKKVVTSTLRHPISSSGSRPMWRGLDSTGCGANTCVTVLTSVVVGVQGFFSDNFLTHSLIYNRKYVVATIFCNQANLLPKYY